MNKLIFVPVPHAEESPYSLIRRVTLFHKFNTVGQFTRRCVGESAVQRAAVSQSSAIAQFLAAEAGAYATAVLNGFYQAVNRAQIAHWMINGVEIPSVYLRLRSFVFCDSCFEEGWQRQVQDLRLSEYCPYHCKRYLTHCPACGGDLKWWHALHGQCHYCGEFLKCDPCGDHDCLPERCLAQSLKSHNQAYIDKIIRTTRLLGGASQNKGVIPDATRCQINEAAMFIANDDVNGLGGHLSALHEAYPEIDKSWIAARFSGMKTPGVAEATTIFMTKTTSTHSTVRSDSPFLLTAGQVRQKMQAEGLHFDSSSQMCKKLNAKRRRFSTEDISALSTALQEYHATSAGRLPTTQTEMWTTNEVAKQLKVNPHVIQIYARDGLLTFYNGRHNKKYFLPADVNKFLEQLQPPHYIAATCGLKVIRIRKAILQCQVKPSYHAELHWSYWLFNLDDVQSIKRALTHERKLRAAQHFNLILPTLPFDPIFFANFMTYAQAARSLGIVKGTVHELIKWQYLKGCYISAKKIYIPRIEVQKFRHHYLNSTATSKILKITVNRLSDVLQAVGIQPLTFPSTTQSRITTIYRKNEIKKFAAQLSTEQSRERQNYLSITIASKRARADERTLRVLASNNILTHVKGQLSIYFRPSVLDLFRSKFAIIEPLLSSMGFPSHPTPKLIETLHKYKTTKMPASSNTAPFYRSSADILSYLHSDAPSDAPALTRIKIATIKNRSATLPMLTHAISLIAALEHLQISNNDFNDTFAKKGFSNIIKHDNGKYLSQKDYEECQRILTTHITCAMADRLVFNNPGTTRCLIRRHILSTEALSDLITKPLIRRDLIARYLIDHPISSHLQPAALDSIHV